MIRLQFVTDGSCRHLKITLMNDHVETFKYYVITDRDHDRSLPESRVCSIRHQIIICDLLPKVLDITIGCQPQSLVVDQISGSEENVPVSACCWLVGFHAHTEHLRTEQCRPDLSLGHRPVPQDATRCVPGQGQGSMDRSWYHKTQGQEKKEKQIYPCLPAAWRYTLRSTTVPTCLWNLDLLWTPALFVWHYEDHDHVCSIR